MGCAKPTIAHWQDLRARDRAVVLAQPGVVAASDGPGYELGFLSARYRVDPAAETITELAPVTGQGTSDWFQILVLNYLCAPHGGALSGEQVSEKELPAGATFFRGPHALQVQDVARRFGADPDGFERHSAALGATRLAHGDRAMRFQPFPTMPVTYILWLTDDEFPASVSVTFDRSIVRWFELDMVFLLVNEISRRLLEAALR